MSRYIGKRVSYPCGWCKKQFTINKNSVTETAEMFGYEGKVFCSQKCADNYEEDKIPNGAVMPNGSEW